MVFCCFSAADLAIYQSLLTRAGSPPVLDRARGCLAGLAIGDALGTTLEFASPGSFTPLTGMVGGGPFGLLPGLWTDDTSENLHEREMILDFAVKLAGRRLTSGRGIGVIGRGRRPLHGENKPQQGGESRERGCRFHGRKPLVVGWRSGRFKWESLTCRAK